MSDCKVDLELDKCDAVYYAGQKLGGVVRVELNAPLLITGLELRLLGGAYIRWLEKKDQKLKTEIEHSAEEKYFDDTFILWGHGRKVVNPDIEELPKGRHSFPFHWVVPRDVPTSYEGPYGWVRYHATCTLLRPCCRPGCNTTLTRKLFFTVLHKVDLNMQPLLSTPLVEHKEIILQTTLCRGGQISCSLELPRSGFVPGEFVQADVDIHNKCARKVKSTCLALRQTVQFGTEELHCRKLSWDICRIHGDRVKPWRKQCWSCSKGLAVPALVPSAMVGCKFIDVRYELQLRVELHSQTLTLSIPIVIGTDPLQECYLSSWNYIEGVTYRNKKKLLLSPPAPVHCPHSMPDGMDIGDYLPKYRVFNVQNPRKTMVVLEASPGESRRRSLSAPAQRPRPPRQPTPPVILLSPSNQESDV